MVTPALLMAQGAFDPRGNNPFAQAFGMDEAARRRAQADIHSTLLRTNAQKEIADLNAQTSLQQAIMGNRTDLARTAMAGRNARNIASLSELSRLAGLGMSQRGSQAEAARQRTHEATEAARDREQRFTLQDLMLRGQATDAEASRKHEMTQAELDRSLRRELGTYESPYDEARREAVEYALSPEGQQQDMLKSLIMSGMMTPDVQQTIEAMAGIEPRVDSFPGLEPVSVQRFLEMTRGMSEEKARQQLNILIEQGRVDPEDYLEGQTRLGLFEFGSPITHERVPFGPIQRWRHRREEGKALRPRSAYGR